MSDHPYWVYGPDHGVPVVDAMAEGRRAFALEKAVQWDDTNEGVLARARLFEQYLKGGVAEDSNGAPL